LALDLCGWRGTCPLKDLGFVTSRATPLLGKVIDGKLLDSNAQPIAYRKTGAMDGASALFPDVFGD